MLLNSCKKICLCLFAAALLVSCASIKAKSSNYLPLYGMVYDDSGKAAAGVSICLDDAAYSVSDFNGRFVFSGVLPGTYGLKASQKNLEDFSQQIRFSGSGDVLYVRMASVDGLYSSFFDALQSKNWTEADRFLFRAIAISPADPLLRYASASLSYAPDWLGRDWQKADAGLLALINDGYREPAVYLLLADIAEYDKGDLPLARGFLELYLRLQFDPSVEARIRSLEEGQAQP